jgi:hypothetical protein
MVMPNWCSNSFEVSHTDPEMVSKFVEAVRAGNLFETFAPLSTKEWDYNAACEEWGTKWDISGGDGDISEDGKSASGWFETAWSPAIIAYEKLEELGFELNVIYHEPGMAYAGQYIQGEDEYYEYDFSNKNWREDILNEDVLEYLECEYESWLQWQDEEEQEEDGSEDSRP